MLITPIYRLVMVGMLITPISVGMLGWHNNNISVGYGYITHR